MRVFYASVRCLQQILMVRPYADSGCDDVLVAHAKELLRKKVPKHK